MPEINYKELTKYLADHEKKRLDAVFLIFGEDVIGKSVFKELSAALVPKSSTGSNYEVVDGAVEYISEAVERMKTYSLFSEEKIVSIIDSRVFYSRQDEAKLLEKIKQEYDNDNMHQAAKYLLDLMGLLHLSFEDLGRQFREKALKADQLGEAVHQCLDDIITYCVEKNLSARSYEDKGTQLQHAIERGFPTGNYLMITTDIVDKRKRLYKSIKKHGLIIDCAVPKGDRKADRAVQASVIKDKAKEILTKNHKKMDADAYQNMYDKIGFDLRTFTTSLEKLIDYIGDRERIKNDDVERVLKRTKKDPLYEFTNAVTDRNLEKGLFYLDSLLGGGDIAHPLQLLAAVVNQIRKLMMVKDFCESPSGRDAWYSGCPYYDFEKKVMPAVVAYDRALLEQLDQWDQQLSADAREDGGKAGKKRKKKKGKSTDLLIAKQPKNVYPVYKMIQKSDNFEKRELVEILMQLGDADARIKSTGQDARMILEEIVLKICRNR